MWGRLSLVAFFFSLSLMLLLYFRLYPFGPAISDLVYILGIFVFGLLGFLFSMISIFSNATKKSEKSREQILIFHLGMILVFFGIITRLLFWPYTDLFFLIGLLLIGISFFMKNRKPSKDNDILDG